MNRITALSNGPKGENGLPMYGTYTATKSENGHTEIYYSCKEVSKQEVHFVPFLRKKNMRVSNLDWMTGAHYLHNKTTTMSRCGPYLREQL